MINRILLSGLIAVAAAPPLAAQSQGARPAARAPQPLTRALYMQRIDSAFAAVDANKDGFTDKAEMEAAQNRALTARKAQALRGREAAFRRLDTDKNGSLTLQEFNAMAAAQALPKPNADPILSLLDTNKDGKISAAENRAPNLTRFDRLDANKDGTVSVAELKAAGRNR